jgi:hypothetical protein
VRDCSVAVKHDKLYNPFWRHLAGKHCPLPSETPSRHGTFRFKGWKQQTWWMFDQIIFSPTFLGGREWHLDEHSTGVLDWDSLLPTMNDFDFNHSEFDHLPVYSRIERRGDL